MMGFSTLRMLFAALFSAVLGVSAWAEDQAAKPNGTPTGLNEDLLGVFVKVPGATISQAGTGNTASITQSGGSGNFSFIIRFTSIRLL